MTTRPTAHPGEPERPAKPPVNRALERHPRPLGGDPARNLRPLVSLSDMVLNNQTAESHQLTIKKKPKWLRAKVPGGEGYRTTKTNIEKNRLNTVCEEAACPNLGECWARGVATIMILGDTCTRACGFCNVKTGKPTTTDWDEPERVAESLAGLGLRYVVITSVDRDDMPDGGSKIWADTIRRVKPAVVLMDVRMPGLDGIKAAQLSSGPQSDAKIILMSGYADQIKRASEEEELDVFAVIDKPLALRVLVRFILAALHDKT